MYMKIIAYIFGLSFLFAATSVLATDYGQAVIVAQKQVQIDPRYYSGIQGYYAVGNQIAQEKQALKAEDLATLSAKVDALIKLFEALAKVQGGGAVPEPVPPAAPAPQEDKIRDDFVTLMKAKCFSCHKNDANGLAIFDNNGVVTGDLRNIVKIHDRAEGVVLEKGESVMPKGGKPLTDAEMKIIKAYMHKVNK